MIHWADYCKASLNRLQRYFIRQIHTMLHWKLLQYFTGQISVMLHWTDNCNVSLVQLSIDCQTYSLRIHYKVLKAILIKADYFHFGREELTENMLLC